MRYFILILICSISSAIYAQRIKKKEIDKFTKSEIIETSNESLYSVNFMASGWCNRFEFCIRRVDGKYAMPASILMSDIVKYTENDGITLLLENDEVVILKTNYTGVGAEPFAKGYWFNTSFSLTDEDVEKLKSEKVVSIRINYMGGNYDKDLKGGKQSLIMKSLKLFDNL